MKILNFIITIQFYVCIMIILREVCFSLHSIRLHAFVPYILCILIFSMIKFPSIDWKLSWFIRFHVVICHLGSIQHKLIKLVVHARGLALIYENLKCDFITIVIHWIIKIQGENPSPQEFWASMNATELLFWVLVSINGC